MTQAIVIVHYVLALALIVASYFDVDSTNKAIRKGAYEANGIMAWFQAKMGEAWWIARVGLAVVPDAITFALPHYIANVALFALLLIYAAVVQNNYSLARDL